MKLFVDTAGTAEIKSLVPGRRPCGASTNRSLVAKTGKKFTDIVREIRAMVRRPAAEHDAMMRQAAAWREIVLNLTAEVPLTICRQ
jgi:transaldolase